MSVSSVVRPVRIRSIRFGVTADGYHYIMLDAVNRAGDEVHIRHEDPVGDYDSLIRDAMKEARELRCD